MFDGERVCGVSFANDNSIGYSYSGMVLFADLLYYCFHFDKDNPRIQLKERFVGSPQTPLHGMFIFATFTLFIYSSPFVTAYSMYTSLKHCIRCSSEIQSVLSSMRIASVFHPNKHAELPYFIMMLYRCSIFPTSCLQCYTALSIKHSSLSNSIVRERFMNRIVKILVWQPSVAVYSYLDKVRGNHVCKRL